MMRAVTDQPFTLRVPLHDDAYAVLANETRWRDEFATVRLPYETRVLAESQLAPRAWVRLTAFTIGSGGEGGVIWIDLASPRPAPTEIIAGRALLRAFAADSSERRRILSRVLLHFVLLEYTEDAERTTWRAPALGDDIGAALVGGSISSNPTLWRALRSDMEQSRPSVVVGLRDAGGVPLAGRHDGLVTMPVALGGLETGHLLASLESRWRGSLGRFSALRGYRWFADHFAAAPELSTSRFLSSVLRFGERRTRHREVPDRLAELELPVYYPSTSSELRSLASAGLLPASPGVFWDVSRPYGGDPLTAAGYAHRHLGAFGLTALATADDPTRRANFLLAATSAAIVAAASGDVG
jgi:hypothetical protein